MSEQPTSDDLAREVTRATSANTQDRGYIPDQIDGGEQSDGIPPLDAAQGTATQSPYDEHGSLANAGLPPADQQAAPPPTATGRSDPRYQDPPMQDIPEQPGRPASDTAQRNADRDDIATNP